MRFHHTGICVRHLDQESSFYKSIGAKIISPSIYDPLQNVNLQMLELGGQNIELVAPGDERLRSPIDNYLKRNFRVYHTCYEVDDINAAIDIFLKYLCIVVLKPTPAILFDMRCVSFVYTPNNDLIELLESK